MEAKYFDTEDLLKLGFTKEDENYFNIELNDSTLRYYYSFSGGCWKLQLNNSTLTIRNIVDLEMLINLIS